MELQYLPVNTGNFSVALVGMTRLGLLILNVRWYGPGDDHAPLCHGGAGVWQLAWQQASAPLYATWKNQGRWSVEVVLHDA